jgi:hypothetical protein
MTNDAQRDFTIGAVMEIVVMNLRDMDGDDEVPASRTVEDRRTEHPAAARWSRMTWVALADRVADCLPQREIRGEISLTDVPGFIGRRFHLYLLRNKRRSRIA